MSGPEQQWKRADLHLHTCHSGWRSLGLIDAQDCYVTPDDAFDTALARGMDYVCFTDHNTIDGALDLLSRRPDVARCLIVGEEVEARLPELGNAWVHINVLDVNEQLHDDLSRLRGNCFELLTELERRGAFFVLNHPFQSFGSVSTAEQALMSLLPRFPAIEVCNGTSPRSQRIAMERLLRTWPAPGPCWVGGSDAHTRRRIAQVHTIAPASDKASFLESLRAGRCAIRGESAGPWSLLKDVYSIIGRYYASVYADPHRWSARKWLRNVFGSTVLLPGVLGGVPAAVTLLQIARQEWIARTGPWSEAWRAETIGPRMNAEPQNE